MLAELIRYARLRCPRYARRLGLAREHVAITFRHRRLRKDWAPHLEASKAVITEAIDRCVNRRRALVIGAGDGRDVPVDELAARFDQVVLCDVVVGPELRGFARKHPGQVLVAEWDATGALEALASGLNTLSTAAVETLFREGEPGQPPGGEPDLVVSANCISQLGTVPASAYDPGDDEGFASRCAEAAAQRHLLWLSARTGVRVLIGDMARLDVAPDGSVEKREEVPGMKGLRAPDHTWLWRLAPIPEFSREFSRVHEVGAWIDAL
jgi:hypothetical protein